MLFHLLLLVLVIVLLLGLLVELLLLDLLEDVAVVLLHLLESPRLNIRPGSQVAGERLGLDSRRQLLLLVTSQSSR